MKTGEYQGVKRGRKRERLKDERGKGYIWTGRDTEG